MEAGGLFVQGLGVAAREVDNGAVFQFSLFLQNIAQRETNFGFHTAAGHKTIVVLFQKFHRVYPWGICIGHGAQG